MTMKVTAITVSACVGLLSAFAMLFPNDPYFYVISSNLIVIICRLLLCIAIVVLASKTKFKTKEGPKFAAIAAMLLAAFGVSGLVVPVMDYSLFNILKPLDYIFLLNCAFVFGMASLSLKHGRRRLVSLLRVSRPARYAQQFRLSLPRGV